VADPARDVDMAIGARGVSVRFEGLTALADVDLSLAKGEILGLIGPNGAGKTTLVNVLTGFQRPVAGAVSIGGRESVSWTPERIRRHGVARTFQAARLFHGLSVRENVELAAVAAGNDRGAARIEADRLLEWLDLAKQADVRAEGLSHGDERWVGLARALAGSPNFVLLDEPAAGLGEAEAHDLRTAIAAIRDEFGCGVLVIEHNMPFIMGLCDRVQVLAQGRTIAVGTPGEVSNDAAVRRAYLGPEMARSTTPRAAPRSEPEAAPLLTVDDLSVNYGAVAALKGVTIRVDRGAFVSVVGPNGAGKSTLLNTIAGLLRPRAGDLRFDDRALARRRAEARVRDGIALVPEGRRIFPALTVDENIRIGGLSQDRNSLDERRAFVLDLFPILRERSNGAAGKLSGGEQQQLAIARALVSNPTLLMLDEPSLGLAPMVVAEVYDVLSRLHQQGLSILLVEENVNRALGASQRSYVLRDGRIVAEGESSALAAEPDFDRAYFGFDRASVGAA